MVGDARAVHISDNPQVPPAQVPPSGRLDGSTIFALTRRADPDDTEPALFVHRRRIRQTGGAHWFDHDNRCPGRVDGVRILPHLILRFEPVGAV